MIRLPPFKNIKKLLLTQPLANLKSFSKYLTNEAKDFFEVLINLKTHQNDWDVDLSWLKVQHLNTHR